MITPADYVLNLGVGDVSPHGARNNSFSLLPMSVPVSCTDEEKQAMFFWLNHGLVWIYAFNHEVRDCIFELVMGTCSLRHCAAPV